jgi:hypothetical protein
MLYRVCIAFFLFLAVLFYWRCTKAKGEDMVSVPLQQCDGENTEFSNQQKVTITGYAGHAMEPFISRDGNYLFFNSLNDAVDTSLYYAAADSADGTVFKDYALIGGTVNKPIPHLDAVASMNDDGQFYFISTRDCSSGFKSVFTGIFSGGTVTPNPVPAVNGDFYVRKPGWIVMDAEVSPVGDKLYFVNAHFEDGPAASSASIGVATWSETDTAFNRDAGSDTVMARINKEGCLNYAPSISADGKELFFTRFCFGSNLPTILVAKRATTSEAFDAPACIDVLKGYFVEAPSLTHDGKKMYYHRKDDGQHGIYLVSRP